MMRSSFSHVSDEKLMILRSLFAECDQDGSGSIEIDELKDLLTKLGHDLPDEEVKDLFNKMDVSGDGRVNFFEFMRGAPREILIGIDAGGETPKRNVPTNKRILDQ